MGIGNQNFDVIEEFISRVTLKELSLEETFTISRILALSAKVYSAKFVIRTHQRKCEKIIATRNFQHFCRLSCYQT